MHRHGNQPLLGAVMKVTLYTATFQVGHLDNAPLRGTHFRELNEPDGPKAGVVERQPLSRRHGGQNLGRIDGSA